MIDDISARTKGQSEYLATQRINNSTKNTIPKISNIKDTILQNKGKVKLPTPKKTL